ncbi:MAG: threonine synthase, partial [Miltoncostaeaceae bacterium]
TTGERVVCVLTGNGLKDPDTAIAQSGQVIEIPADYAAAERALYGG